MNKPRLWAGACLLLCLLSLSIGVGSFSWSDWLSGNQASQLLLLESRIPRTISLVLAGAGISLSGLLMQLLTQNSFAAPSTIGTTDAAKLGILLSLFLPAPTITQKIILALGTSLFFSIFFLKILRKLFSSSPWLLPLVGMVYGGLLSAGGQFLAYQFELVQSLSSWSLGSFAMVQTQQYEWLFGSLLLVLASSRLATAINIMGLGADTSQSLGVPQKKLEFLILLLISLTTSLTMVTVGSLPFVGVLVPNLVRRYYGDSLEKSQTITALAGACLLLVADILARTIIAPYEVAISLILGIAGSLVFLILIWRSYRHASYS